MSMRGIIAVLFPFPMVDEGVEAVVLVGVDRSCGVEGVILGVDCPHVRCVHEAQAILILGLSGLGFLAAFLLE